MYLPDFNFYKPGSVNEALSILEKSKNAALMAGGTDLLVEMKKGLRNHENIISLMGIQSLRKIEEDENNLYIGAGVTHNELILSPLVSRIIPSLSQAVSKIGSEQVRNSGTIGGNLCTAASCCDTAPILLSVNASLEIADTIKTTVVALKDFFVFNKRTILKKGELLDRIIIPKLAKGTGAYYEKFGLREAGSISVVSVAVMVGIKNNAISRACVVIGAVAPTPKISEKANDVLLGKKLSELMENSALLGIVGKAAAEDSIPIDDIRGGAQYRRDILKVLTQRAVLKAVINAGNNQ
jgi:carbon-monoxide dehydrogenase medium subunit